MSIHITYIQVMFIYHNIMNFKHIFKTTIIIIIILGDLYYCYYIYIYRKKLIYK